MRDKTKNRAEYYMQRCLQLAAMGRAHTSPNPMVGAVVVYEDRIIGEGYHAQCGKAHAEVNAIASVKEVKLLSSATLYVSLEPCSHYGKTPPCSELIIRKGIPRVVVGVLDPFPAVSGRGVAMLRKAGVAVTVGVLESECRELNRSFMQVHERQAPLVTLKWAESADGYIDRVRTPQEPPSRLSNSVTTALSHRLRTLNDAILVGWRTAICDNPSLTVRHWSGKDPLRVVIDRDGTLPPSLHLLNDGRETVVFTTQPTPNTPHVSYELYDADQPLVPQLLKSLYRRGVHRLLVEGGSALLQQFIASNGWDVAQVEHATLKLGGGVAAPQLQGTLLSVEQYGENRVMRYRNDGSK